MALSLHIERNGATRVIADVDRHTHAPMISNCTRRREESFRITDPNKPKSRKDDMTIAQGKRRRRAALGSRTQKIPSPKIGRGRVRADFPMQRTSQPLDISTYQRSSQNHLANPNKSALIIQTMRETTQKCVRSKLGISSPLVVSYEISRNCSLDNQRLALAAPHEQSSRSTLPSVDCSVHHTSAFMAAVSPGSCLRDSSSLICCAVHPHAHRPSEGGRTLSTAGPGG